MTRPLRLLIEINFPVFLELAYVFPDQTRPSLFIYGLAPYVTLYLPHRTILPQLRGVTLRNLYVK